MINNIQFCIMYLESKNKLKINGKKKFEPLIPKQFEQI